MYAEDTVCIAKETDEKLRATVQRKQSTNVQNVALPCAKNHALFGFIHCEYSVFVDLVYK